MRDFMKNLIFTLSAILAGYLTADNIFYGDKLEEVPIHSPLAGEDTSVKIRDEC